MAQFTIQSIIGSSPWQSAGGQMYQITMAGILDGDLTPNAQINAKSPDKYLVGQTIDVSVTPSQYGPKLKLNPPPLPGAISPQQASPTASHSGAEAKSFVPYDKSSEREYIVRQSTLERAVTYCIAKANFLADHGTAAQKKSAHEYMEGKKVLEVANYYFKYCMGEVKVEIPRTTETEMVMADPLPEEESSPRDEEGS